MQHKNSKGTAFVPALENWSLDFPCRTDGAPATQRNARQQTAATCNAARGWGILTGRNARSGATPVVCTGTADCACEACTRQRTQQQKVCPQQPVCPAETPQTCNACETCAQPTCPQQPACQTAAQSCYACESCPQQTVCPQQSACQTTATASGSTCPWNGASQTNATWNVNSRVGMVYAAWQTLADVYDAESALRLGTLFPELNKPLNGYWPCGGYCATPCQENAFAAWDLRLYLNTHPDDAQALQLFRQMTAQMGLNYANAFLDAACAAQGWSWVSDPWPWEYDCTCGN